MNISQETADLVVKIADTLVAVVTGLSDIAKDAVSDLELGLTDIVLVNDLIKTVTEAIAAFRGE